MEKRVKSRGSSLPLNVLCGASLEPGLSVESADRDAADLGSAIHAVMAEWIVSGYSIEAIPRNARTFRVDYQDLAALSHIAWKQWKEHLAPSFPDPQVELPLEFADDENGIVLTGHCDVISLSDPPTIRILDFKSGFGDGDSTPQIQGYAWMAIQTYPDFDSVNAGVLRLREGAVEGYAWSRGELEEWYAWLVERLNDRTYRPGRHCAFCPRGPSCEAKTSLLQQSLAMVPMSGVDLPNDPGERAARLEEILVASRLVAKAAGDAQELIRAEVRAAGGRLGNLELLTETRRKIVMPEALPILLEELGEDLEKVLEVKKTSVEKAIGDRAPYRQKGKRIKEVLDRLDAIGAMKETTRETLKVRTQPKQIKEQL